jgi:sugar fermentation stimulation protein A
MLLEVKSVTLVEGRVGLFPDAVTARGARHVRELTALQRSGDWATAVLFVLQRPDADRIAPDAAIDPEFARAVAEARRAGVRMLGRRCAVGLEGLTLGPAIPVRVRR